MSLNKTSFENSSLKKSASDTPLSLNLASIRHDWTIKEVNAFFKLPFNDLMFQAQTIHRQTFNPNQVQVSTLLSIKTGACPEDCK